MYHCYKAITSPVLRTRGTNVQRQYHSSRFITLVFQRKTCKLTDQQIKIVDGNIPMPLYTCVHVKKNVSARAFQGNTKKRRSVTSNEARGWNTRVLASFLSLCRRISYIQDNGAKHISTQSFLPGKNEQSTVPSQKHIKQYLDFIL